MLTSNSLWRQERQDPKWVSLMQAVKQPHKVAVPPNDLAPSPRAGYLVVVVLEQEHALLLRHECHEDRLLHGRPRSSIADGPTGRGHRCRGQATGRLRAGPAAVDPGDPAKWGCGIWCWLVESTSGRRVAVKKSPGAGSFRHGAAARGRHACGKRRGRPARYRHLWAGSIDVPVRGPRRAGHVMAVGPWWFGAVVVVPVHVGRVPRVFGVIHRRLPGTAVPLRRHGLGGLRRRRGSLGRLRGEFLDVRQGRHALDKLVEIRLGQVWGVDTTRLAPIADGDGAHSRRAQSRRAGDDRR